MKTYLENVRICDPYSTWNGRVVNLILKEGYIAKIEEFKGIEGEGLNLEGASVSPGWCDLQCHSGEPGFEYRENRESLIAAAIRGGFTSIAIQPNVLPAADNGAAVQNIKNLGKGYPIEVLPIGAATKNLKGEQLSEMLDLIHNGAVAISQGVEALHNSDLIFKILQYLSSTGIVFIHRGTDKYLSQGGQMNESQVSTYLGLKGIPSLAEELTVVRDLKLTDRAKGTLHLAGISTEESVEHIRIAKQIGVKVTSSVAAHQLAFTDEALTGFDSNLKVWPPFRSTKDLEAIKVGLLDGTIDAVFSDHTPLSEEEKELEFDRAYFGITGLETCFSVFNHFGTAISDDRLVHLLSVNPRKILGQKQVVIEAGASVNLTFFNRAISTEFNLKERKTLSKNCPFYGLKLKGKVLGTALGNEVCFQK